MAWSKKTNTKRMTISNIFYLSIVIAGPGSLYLVRSLEQVSARHVVLNQARVSSCQRKLNLLENTLSDLWQYGFKGVGNCGMGGRDLRYGTFDIIFALENVPDIVRHSHSVFWKFTPIRSKINSNSLLHITTS